MKSYQLAISTGFGLEAVTKREIGALLGAEHCPARQGLIRLSGTDREIAMCNLWLRTAERVYIVAGEEEGIDTFDKLFAFVHEIDWGLYLPQNANIHVLGKSVDSTLFGVSACQSIAKKAIVVKMMETYHTREVTEDGAQYDITVDLYKDKCTILIDTSGKGLHRRGYRTLVGEAAIKETMAAALILLSVWNPSKPLIDPFCGSGTIPIEAALIGRNIAPGLNRSFAFENWTGFDVDMDELRGQARAAINDAPLTISGFDIDPEAIKLCRYHAKAAGVEDCIHFQCMDMREVSSRYYYGVIVTNPPYGERLLDDKQVDRLMRDFGKVYAALNEWSLYLISSYPFLERAIGKQADKTRKLYNGKLQCRLYQFMGAKPPKKE